MWLVMALATIGSVGILAVVVTSITHELERIAVALETLARVGVLGSPVARGGEMAVKYQSQQVGLPSESGGGSRFSGT
jgi:hypothetical protein